MQRHKLSLITLCLSIIFLTTSDCSKILLIAPLPGPSHWLMFEHLIGELLSRGHHISAITSYKYNSLENGNYTEILIDPKYDFENVFPQEEVYKSKYNNWNMLFKYWPIGIETTKYALEHPIVQNFIKRDDLQFDLVLSEQFFQESCLMFAHKFNAPILTLGTYGYSDFMDRIMGFLTPWAFIPHFILTYNTEMSFMERAYNVYFSLYDMIYRKYYYLPDHDELAQKHFGNLRNIKKPLPSVAELEKSISVILVNDHRSISPPRPLMPGMIDIGGMHIKPPKPLPSDIKKFIDEAKHGTIYFCLGSFLNTSKMPKEKVQILLKSFRKLKQRVLWKFEADIPNLPENVMIRKWMPQSDILAHENVVLFISHGGLYGTMEGTSRGKPILFTPLFADQYHNALKAVEQGNGLMQKFSEITTETFYKKIIEIITNPKYQKRATEMSLLFNDNIVPPMDTAIYWIEYTINHRGAPHLKSKSVDLPIYKYLLLDIVFAHLILLFGVCYFLRLILKKLFFNNKKVKMN